VARSLASAYASILFAQDPLAGALVLLATLGRPASAVGGLVAVAAANGCALALGYRREAIVAGSYGYNALLLGLGIAAGHALDAGALAVLVLAGAASVLLAATLGDALARGARLPALALPFVLLASALGESHSLIEPHAAALPATSWLEDAPVFSWSVPVPEPALSVLRAIGAIFFRPDAGAGILVLGAALSLSRIGAVALVSGAWVGLAVARALGTNATSATGLGAAMNAALAATAIGAHLLVPGRASALAGLGAAVLAAWLACALAPLSARTGIPLLAWPFVLATLLVLRSLQLRGGDRAPFEPATPGLSPEANLERAEALAVRFAIPGPPRLVLPVAGAWTVTQGHDGEHTHRGPWAHAWDLERLDERGFPFRGDGTAKEDYLSFGEPVLAPGAGEVAQVHDGLPDGAPGELDTRHPWGNAVVLRHGPELFSVVAHLKQGSVLVRPGQLVAAGQPVAACGSSGRSPRPHVHVQAQRTAELGAPALACRIFRYAVETGAGSCSLVQMGIPAEGERVSTPARSPLLDAFAALPPGVAIELEGACAGREVRVRLRSEVDPLGERWLRDLDRGDRLTFLATPGDVAFLTHHGPAGAPLRALLLALPRLPSVDAPRVRYEDAPPATALLGPVARIGRDLVRVALDPVTTRTEAEMTTEGDHVLVRTRTGFGLGGRVRWLLRGRVEIGPEGLEVLELARHGTAGPRGLADVTTLRRLRS
jgi:urea transporter/murein DD-endopeptidase MepM/ murein hydrolase activator NlpD